MYITPDQSIKAREQLSMSQSKAASAVGINRAYLSEFESSKRVLEDHAMDKLTRFYKEQGWKPDVNVPVAQSLNSDKHGLTLVDGMVVGANVPKNVQEQLLAEMYELETEIEELMERPVKQLLFGGLDENDSLSRSIRPLLLMCRQNEIKKILQGRIDGPYSEANGSDRKSINTIGDYIEATMKNAVPDRFPEGLQKSA